ncbi:hypothetical protein DFH28DRAFT_1080718 [Melampsora americana]|nr:hypothetical protein DFH28DRAFT_1080718 [Melampsora americana]
MIFTSLGLNLAALSQTVCLNDQNTTKTVEDSTIQTQDIIKSYPFDLFPSNKLLTWAPQLDIETLSLTDDHILAVMDLDHLTSENCHIKINALSDGEKSLVTIEVAISPVSSPSAQSVSCYSCESEEEMNSNESDSSLSSILEEDSIHKPIVSQKLLTSPFSISTPHHNVIVASTNDLLAEPITLKDRSSKQEPNHLSTNQEWDDYINELAEALEREFRCDFEFSSHQEIIRRAADVIEDHEEEVEARDVLGSRSSPSRHLQPDHFDLDTLFESERKIYESEFTDEIEPRTEEFNHPSDRIFDQEVTKNSLRSSKRYASVLRLNPHLSHLFD